MNRKRYLLGMTLHELQAVAAQVGLPSYAAKQMADWIYKKRVTSIQEMTNIAAAKRALLEEQYEVGAYASSDEMRSSDGTVKYLFTTAGHHAVETVFIPSEDRATLCVSSQVGCRMNCLFCMTGKQGLAANLTAHEIMNQLQSVPESEQLTNVVFMGMGEPFDNTTELFKVLEVLTASYGYAWSPSRITVSTIGVIKGLKEFLETSRCHLAISLHSPFPEERSALMPIQKVHPLEEVLALIRTVDFSHQRRIFFEYILFDGLNDSLRHAKELARLLGAIPCRVNLIRFHAIPDVELKSTHLKKMEMFRDELNARGIISTIRASRGEDILAACGMLSTKKKQSEQ